MNCKAKYKTQRLRSCSWPPLLSLTLHYIDLYVPLTYFRCMKRGKEGKERAPCLCMFWQFGVAIGCPLFRLSSPRSMDTEKNIHTQKVPRGRAVGNVSPAPPCTMPHPLSHLTLIHTSRSSKLQLFIFIYVQWKAVLPILSTWTAISRIL